MSLDVLLKKIRSEEVALFVGSGLSLYAGYRGAQQLREMICNAAQDHCTDELERDSLKGKNLEEIAECLVRFSGSREVLNQVIVEQYGKKPEATYIHDRLGRIPHFDHVFTTNYDTLIEDSMEKRCHVIADPADFPYQDIRFPKVYKLHGDVNHLENIVITKGDYAKNIRQQQPNLLWNRFRDVTASRDILFLGHSFEDSNIWGIYEELQEQLEHHQRMKFLVCPNLQANQQAFLRDRGFIYLDMTGEELLDRVYPELIDHAVGDCEAGRLTLGTFERFVGFNEKSVIIKTQDQAIRVEAIREKDGSVQHEVQLTLTGDISRQLMKFNQGRVRQKSFVIPSKDLLSFSMSMSGFKLPLEAQSMTKVEVLNIPQELYLNLESEDGRIEHTKLPLKRYMYADGSNLEFNIHSAGFLLIFKQVKNVVKVSFEFKLPKHFDSVSETLDVVLLIMYLFTGKKIDMYIEGRSCIPIVNQKPMGVRFDQWDAQRLIQYLEALRFLERKFKVKFGKIALEDIHRQTVEEAVFLYRAFSEGFVEIDMENVILLPKVMTKYSLSDDDDLGDENRSLIVETPNNYMFHGVQLPKIYPKLEVLQAEVIGNDKQYAIKSKINKVRHKFLTAEQFEQIQVAQNETMTVQQFVGNLNSNL